MGAADIEEILGDNYIGMNLSRTVRVSLSGGNVLYGQFLESLQTAMATTENRWMFTCCGMGILLEGEDIISISSVR